ncbi:uncharacterized [Tachysurus ichikawai]
MSSKRSAHKDVHFYLCYHQLPHCPDLRLAPFRSSTMTFRHDPVCCAAAICSSLFALDTSRPFGVCSRTKTNKRPGRVSLWVLDHFQGFLPAT